MAIDFSVYNYFKIQVINKTFLLYRQNLKTHKHFTLAITLTRSVSVSGSVSGQEFVEAF